LEKKLELVRKSVKAKQVIRCRVRAEEEEAAEEQRVVDAIREKLSKNIREGKRKVSLQNDKQQNKRPKADVIDLTDIPASPILGCKSSRKKTPTPASEKKGNQDDSSDSESVASSPQTPSIDDICGNRYAWDRDSDPDGYIPVPTAAELKVARLEKQIKNLKIKVNRLTAERSTTKQQLAKNIIEADKVKLNYQKLQVDMAAMKKNQQAAIQKAVRRAVYIIETATDEIIDGIQ
jgi:hypothetical protein